MREPSLVVASLAGGKEEAPLASVREHRDRNALMKAVFEELLLPTVIGLPQILDLHEDGRLPRRMAEGVIDLPRTDLEFRSDDLDVEDWPSQLMQDTLYHTLADLGLASKAAGADTLREIFDRLCEPL